MTKKITPLAPLSFPLTGSHLIEASAGTGKTFTIAMLYVRLVLGHGGSNAFQGGPLMPTDILVVTFTDAATKELRDRIRARLAEAARYFRVKPAEVLPPVKTDLLHELRAEYDPALWSSCARKLELAAEWMDEAAVSTIHGWCNRMLREHAFDSQSLFTQKLETDQTELRSEVVRDYWRNFFYPLSIDDMEQVGGYWASPAELEETVKSLIDHADQLLKPCDPAEILSQTRIEKQKALDELKKPWGAWADELKLLFEGAKAKGHVDGKKIQARYYEPWFESLRNWAMTPALESPSLSDSGWWRLSPAGIEEAWTKAAPPDHPAIDEIPKLQAALAALPDPKTSLLSHAAHWIAEAFMAAQKRRAQMGFNDLLTGLEAALKGPHGERLADVIRRQFPVALIDEFQDTDPIQYRIFERIYEIADNRQDCALILIGDPKQAIYAFRGADIYTYLKAREAVQGRLYTLDTNFRSTHAMVDATNHCFERIEQQASSAGAFLFRKDDDNPVPFFAVKANGRKDGFNVSGKNVPALTLAVLTAQNDEIPKSDYISQMSNACATQIVEWLNQGQTGSAGFIDDEAHLVPVMPGDVAILVNNGDEAKNVRQALSRRGVRSVYLSDKDSVYASRQAWEVYRWLCACAEPDNDRLLRAALSTASLGLSFAELDAMSQDEEIWESRIIQFKGYREVWLKQGVLPMLRRLLFDFDGNQRLLNLTNDLNGNSGERILTDILHLAELLQQASYTLEGEHALIRYLAEQIASPEGEAEGKKLRLESDADLVKVVTIHKSKGLEYPLVFLPFICATRLTKAKDVPLKWHDEYGTLRISLEASPEVIGLADQDRLGEDLRKVYVALTRARYVSWLGLGPVSNCDPSAIGHLLGLTGTPPSGYVDAVKTFAKGQPAITVEEELTVSNTAFTLSVQAPEVGVACRPKPRIRDPWWISSYSGLRIEGHAAPVASTLDDTPRAENLLEGQGEVTSSETVGPRAKDPMHRFFKGAEAGTFLHELMEWVANAGLSTILANPEPLRDTIARRCRVRRWEAWVDPLFDWVQRMLRTSLPLGTPISLESLQTYKVEMEFWFETHLANLEQLDAAVIAHTLDQRHRPKLLPATLNGMLKGFMDLVFEHQGRYYVVDYKSNWLGNTDEEYTHAKMDEAIRQHRYDLQYALYLFALHRHLKSRLPDYDYDRHIGGAAYLFVRGISAATAGVHFERPPKVLMETLDTLFIGNAGSAS